MMPPAKDLLATLGNGKAALLVDLAKFSFQSFYQLANAIRFHRVGRHLPSYQAVLHDLHFELHTLVFGATARIPNVFSVRRRSRENVHLGTKQAGAVGRRAKHRLFCSQTPASWLSGPGLNPIPARPVRRLFHSLSLDHAPLVTTLDGCARATSIAHGKVFAPAPAVAPARLPQSAIARRRARCLACPTASGVEIDKDGWRH